jgi:hypothetical protein
VVSLGARPKMVRDAIVSVPFGDGTAVGCVPVVGAPAVAVGFVYCTQHPLTTYWLLLVFVSTVHLA